jgi:CheY-like chemotaxis protein
MSAATRRTVAVFNASADTIEMLSQILSLRGHRAVSGAVDDVKSGEFDLIAFLETQQPDGLIWDIAPPYDRNWSFFKLVRSVTLLQQCAIVVTTTNKNRLDALVSYQTGAVELVGKPYDLEMIVDAVERLMLGTQRPLRAVEKVSGRPTTEQP